MRCWLNLAVGIFQLWYFDDRTPPGWQPEYFREADPSELAFKNGKSDKDIQDKLKIKIGDLQTPHHTLSVGHCPTSLACLARALPSKADGVVLSPSLCDTYSVDRIINDVNTL